MLAIVYPTFGFSPGLSFYLDLVHVLNESFSSVLIDLFLKQQTKTDCFDFSSLSLSLCGVFVLTRPSQTDPATSSSAPSS